MLNKLIMISVLLFICIVMMVVSLLMDAETFGMVSGYISIVCVVISLLGVLIVLRKNKI